MLDIRKLKLLAELDELGTIAAVARSLHLTAPGISMQLAALEREVGLPLTERHGRRVRVTPAGKLLVRHTHQISDMLTVAEMEVTSLREGGAGHYTVAAFPSAARTFVADAWKSLRDSDEVALSLTLTELEPSHSLPALAAGEVDLAIAHSYSNMPPITAPGLEAFPLMTETVRLAVPDDRSTPDVADLADYSTHNWIVPHTELTCHEMVQRACGLAGFAPRTVATATDFDVQLALVAAGIGVALIPQLGATQLPPGVAMRELTRPIVRYNFAVTRTSSATDRGLHRVRTLLRTAATESVALR